MEQHGKDKIVELMLRQRFEKCRRLVERELGSVLRKFGRAQIQMEEISGKKEGRSVTKRHELKKTGMCLCVCNTLYAFLTFATFDEISLAW